MDDGPAPSPERAREAWDAANAVQKDLEAAIPEMALPPPDMATYGASRLAQVSEISRAVGQGYTKLFQLVRSPAALHH